MRFGFSKSPTDQDNGKAMLELLEQANLFIIPLDDERRWYRYHHLFADLLRARLEQTYPNLLPELHRRASAWYEENGSVAKAVDQINDRYSKVGIVIYIVGLDTLGFTC